MLVLVPIMREVKDTYFNNGIHFYSFIILDRRPIDPPPIVQMRLNNAAPQQTEYVLPMII